MDAGAIVRRPADTRLAPQVHCSSLGRLRVERRTSGEASSVWQECNGEKETELEEGKGLSLGLRPWVQLGASEGNGLGPAVSCYGRCSGADLFDEPRSAVLVRVSLCAPRSPMKPRATEKSVRKSRPGGVPPAGRQRRNRCPTAPHRRRYAVPAPGWWMGARRPKGPGAAPARDSRSTDSVGRRGAPSRGRLAACHWGTGR
jgi:hypothetical protein